MQQKKGGELICMRPDSIVEARFKLTKKQNDIIDIVFATIGNDNKLQYEIDISKYAKLYNIQNQSHIYEDLKKAVKTFEGKGFSVTQKINKTKKNRIYFAWFSSIQYIDGEGKIIVELGQTLKRILLEVKRAVFYDIEYTLNFNCIYSKRLYYYLKLYEDTKIRIDNLDILRDKLECPKSYKKYSNFRRFVLEPAYEEINGSSDIRFTYQEIKLKNKVISIKFIIESNKTNMKFFSKNEIAADTTIKAIESPKEQNNNDKIKIVKSIIKENINDIAAQSIFDAADGDIQKIKEKYDLISNFDVVRNIVGAMIKALNEDWKTVGKTKVSTFNDYKQRTYDYDELEKKLLGWDKEE